MEYGFGVQEVHANGTVVNPTHRDSVCSSSIKEVLCITLSQVVHLAPWWSNHLFNSDSQLTEGVVTPSEFMLAQQQCEA